MTLPPDSDQSTGFAGKTVAAFESRMADHMAKLISRHGGIPLVGPSMQEIPLENNPEALDFADHLMAGSIDMLILLTDQAAVCDLAGSRTPSSSSVG